jgi:hypothetical protein
VQQPQPSAEARGPIVHFESRGGGQRVRPTELVKGSLPGSGREGRVGTSG